MGGLPVKSDYPDGVWPVMLTPFTDDNRIDEASLKRLVDWYIARGVDGLFAVCQSSEMFFLSLEERVHLTEAVVRFADGRVPVIASGQVSDTLEGQLEEINAVAACGPAAVILITNRFAAKDESDEVWLANLQALLDRLDPSIPLGFYECPYPYKRVICPETLGKVARTGRFFLMKDTCCDAALIREKLAAIKGTPLRLYNANTATLWDSLQAGAAGYSGVMANFHPELYVWLCRHFTDDPAKAKLVSDFLTVASFIEHKPYPVNAKYHQQLIGNFTSLMTRTRPASDLDETNRSEVLQLKELSDMIAARLQQE
ncbi:MAG: dihydrodipicolinate synthase family protein [Firmicutes bacterium]|nr:dihydrodipicolinate synthase family protein [Bacillota bacterium]